MRFENIETVSCEVLVVGGGGAGLRAAVQARESGADVIMASKSRVGYGNNTYIAAGITGDGLALALHLGLPLKDMEFIQFLPHGPGWFPGQDHPV